jgi:hypothetical protein
MNDTHWKKLIGSVFALALSVFAGAADRIELVDGSIVLGKLLSAERGKFKVETAFAGTIEIAQDKIKGFATEEAVNVGFAAGRAVFGKIEPAAAGIKVVAAAGELAVATGEVAAVWRAGADSPEMRRLKEETAKKERRWAYEASVAIAGRTGANEKFGSNLGFKATLESARDKFVFGLTAERAKDNGADTANRQTGFADYSAFYSRKNVWYARTALEKDKIKALDLRSTSAFGLGHKFIKTVRQDLEARLGASYLHESYTNGNRFDSPGLDAAVLHSYQFTRAKLLNALTYTPAFKNFSNYRLRHESSLELPMGLAFWKLKFGIANDYLSRPPAGTAPLDTTYFTSLLLNWK